MIGFLARGMDVRAEQIARGGWETKGASDSLSDEERSSDIPRRFNRVVEVGTDVLTSQSFDPVSRLVTCRTASRARLHEAALTPPTHDPA